LHKFQMNLATKERGADMSKVYRWDENVSTLKSTRKDNHGQQEIPASLDEPRANFGKKLWLWVLPS